MIPIDWSPLTLVSRDIPLVSPCLKISLELHYDFDPAHVAEFYESAWQLLSRDLNFHSGNGGRTKLRPATMPARIEQLAALEPRKRFVHMLQGTRFGQSAAGMNFFVRYDPSMNLDFDTVEWRAALDERARSGGTYPLPSSSWAQVAIPVDHPLVVEGRAVQWLVERPLSQSKGLISATVGYAVLSCRGETVSVPSMRDLYTPLVAKLEEVGRAHPFLEQEYASGTCMRLEPVAPRVQRQALPLLKHLSWRTLISRLTLERAGFDQWIGDVVAQHAGNVRFEPAPQGVWLQLGDDPSRQLTNDESSSMYLTLRAMNQRFGELMRTSRMFKATLA